MNALVPFVEFSLTGLDQSVGERFEEQVRLRGDTLAIRDRDQTYTYAALNAAANAVAHALHARAPRAEEVVAVLVPDGAGMVIALLGVWKAGKVAVPIDPALPSVRRQQMLRESAAEVIVAEVAAAATEFSGESDLPALDVESAVAAGPFTNLALPVAPGGFALVLFTSGSSGTPRGVAVDHRSLLYRVLVLANLLQRRPGDRQLVTSSCRHAAGIDIVAGSLVTGSSLFVFDLKRDGPASIVAALETQAITVFTTIVTIARQVIGAARAAARFPDLRIVATAGEPVLYRDLALLAPHVSPSCTFVNFLASTEVPVYAAHIVDRSGAAVQGQVPIGDPVLPVEMKLLDEAGREVAENQTGEMVVRSRYLARGYWRRPDLTAAAFIPDPGDPAIKTFRTGDLGVRRADGSILYMGRKDAQVKVRGYRIEPIEVEMALLDHPDVKECVVVASERSPGERELVAYVLPRDGGSLDVGSVITHARARLPQYMVPSAFPVVSTLPRTHSGKVDRRAMPPFDWSSYERRFVGGEPTTATEEALRDIWRAVLGHDAIGVHDDYFELGGHSLFAIQVFRGVEEVFGATLDTGVLIDAPTIAKLATLIDSRNVDQPTLVTVRAHGERPAFFCVPGIDGEILSLRHLARHLGEDQPFHVLNPRSLERTSTGPIPIETLAAHFVGAVRQHQPCGPYFLGGHSSGGVIALEMARALLAQGHAVPTVALLDSNAESQMNDLTTSPGARRLYNFLPPSGRLTVVRAAQALRRHKVKPYAGRVDLFSAVDEDDQPDRGWRLLAAGLHVHDIPGDHLTMLQAPHVQHLANRLRFVIDSAASLAASAEGTR